MALPSTREQFKEYCLRALGKPVIEINVSDEQVEDRIDEALKYYYDYHHDGSHIVYIKHPLEANNFVNNQIEIPITEDVIGITEIFDTAGIISSSNMFDIRYQLALNDIQNLSSFSISPYYVARQNLRLIEEVIVGRQPIRYNRHINKLYVDIATSKVNVGDYIIIKAYKKTDPATYSDVWADRWLARYTQALIKIQWGSHMSKYEGVQLMSGISFSGRKIYEDGLNERNQLEDEMIATYSIPTSFEIG